MEKCFDKPNKPEKVNGTFHKIESGCHSNNLSASHGKLVPMVENNIDLASSTYVNNPIIPDAKPLDCILKNKKYQAIIGFDKDIKGAVWPEWMKEPIIHALGIDEINTNISGMVSGIVDIELKDKIVPVIERVDNRVTDLSGNVHNLSVGVNNLSVNVNNLSVSFETFIRTPATELSLGLVKSSDKINQISVLVDGTMEINDVFLSKISQDINLIISSQSISENPYQNDTL